MLAIGQTVSYLTSLYSSQGLYQVEVVVGRFAMQDIATYDAYGNLTQNTGSTQNAYRFAGEQFDSHVGQYYLRARYYDAGVGRFSKRDPFEGDMTLPLSLAKYPYVHGNPVNATDPSGMFLIAGETLRELWEKTLVSLDTAVRYKNASELLWAAKYAGQLVIYSAINIAVTSALIAAEYYIVENIKEEIQKYRVPAVIYGSNDHPEHAEHIYSAITGDGYTRSRRGSPPCSPVNTALPSGSSHFILSLIEKTWRDDSSWMNLVLATKCPEVVNYVAPPGTKRPSGRRDEYPFISVAEGGVSHYLFDNSVSLKVVSQTESGKQGWLMTHFYRDKEVDLDPRNPFRDKFLVVPIPFLAVDSGYITRKGEFKDYKSLKW